jgi:enamine deaminase RidA (YjgF/YER057c/UK114 family)
VEQLANEGEIMKKERVFTGTTWESIVGYCRAVRCGEVIHVSGTTATDAQGNLVGVRDPAAQTAQAIENIRSALSKLGAGLPDVVRTRIYVRNMDDWEVIGRIHGEYFGDIRPATTLVEVSRLVDPDMLVEIEAEAVVEN